VAPAHELTVDEARGIIDRACEAVASLGTLKAQRKRVTPARRNKIGERDGWICCICAEPIDPTLKLLQRSPQETHEHREHLAQYGLEDYLLVIAWVGADGNQAHSAARWFLTASSTSSLPAETLSSYFHTFWDATWPATRARTEHNKKTASVEHLHPVALGGDNALGNLAIAHLGCNTHYNPQAENADLVAAPKDALVFLKDLRRGSTDGEALAGCLNRVCLALGACGIDVPDREVLVARFPSALRVVHDAFADMWDARRECMRHLHNLRMEGFRSGTAESQARVREIGGGLEAVPWREHTAEWWRRQRAELPELSPGNVDRMRAWEQDYDVEDILR
jgi:hypothetical protein